MTSTPTRILVTGAAGYIGSHACLRLVEAGLDVVGLDNLSRGHRGAFEAISKAAEELPGSRPWKPPSRIAPDAKPCSRTIGSNW